MNAPEPNQPGAPAWPEGPRTGRAESGSGPGDEGLSAALSVLGGLPDLPVAEHAAVYEGLHAALLEALDAGADPAGSGAAGVNAAGGEA